MDTSLRVDRRGFLSVTALAGGGLTAVGARFAYSMDSCVGETAQSAATPVILTRHGSPPLFIRPTPGGIYTAGTGGAMND